MKKSGLITLRTIPEAERRLQKLVKLDMRSKPDEIRFVLDTGIKTRLKEIALEKYANKELTLAKAAELSEISIWEMIDLLKAKKISYNLDIESVLEGLK